MKQPELPITISISVLVAIGITLVILALTSVIDFSEDQENFIVNDRESF